MVAEMPQPECTKESIRTKSSYWKRGQIRTSTNVEDTSRNPPNGERGRLGPGRENTEQCVNDVFLTHQDGDEDIGDNSVGNLSSVRLVSRRETDEYGHVGREGDTEKPSVDGKEQVTEIPDGLGVLLLDVLFISITLPPEGLLPVGDVLNGTRGTGNSFLRFRGGREIDDFGFMNSWLWEGDGLVTVRKRVNIGESKENQKDLLTLELVSSHSTSRTLELGGIKEESVSVCKIP